MKTVVIDGVEQEAQFKQCHDGWQYLRCRPIPKPKKTLVEIAAETIGWDSSDYRDRHAAGPVYAAIEERLKALEEK